MNTIKQPRVALCGINLETNAFSPVSTEDDFRSLCYLEGEDLIADVRSDAAKTTREVIGFVTAMDATGPWQPVPLVFGWCHPWGPVDQKFFDYMVNEMARRIEDNGGVDAVFVASHGAMVATGNPDPDADMLERLRQVVGPEVPIVGTLDLHANVSERSIAASDLLVAYQTNPHVDMFERGEESAHALRAILAGSVQPKTAYAKVPLTPPTATLLTRAGPYADIINFGQRRKREFGGRILNVSISAGFVYADTDTTGMAIWVTGRHDLEPAQALLAEIAERVWSDRERFKVVLTPMDEAVQAAVERGKNPNLPAQIYADIGDNPGGGGCGNTTELLAALIEAGAEGVLMGAIFDPELAATALQAGVGAELDAVFNTNPRTMFSTRYECKATVAAVSTEAFVGRLGQYAGTLIEAAPTVALRIGGITVVVISNRYQTSDPMFFEHLGLDIGQARTVIVKSRGHFRAGFEPWFTPDRVLEVDTPGFTSPMLNRFDWKGLPRPVYPLDEDTEWTPPEA